MSEPRARILAVDDRPENLFSLEMVLRKLEVDVVSANSGAEAMNHLRDSEFAAILVDYQMPDMNGIELASAVSALEEHPEVPILLITEEHPSRQVELACYRAGIVEVIVRPFDAEILRAKLRWFITLYTTQAELRLVSRQAQDNARAKSTFLANMSHEIRTPMHGILGVTEMLLLEEHSAEHRKKLRMVRESANGLLQILDDILDVSKLDADKLKLAPVRFSVGRLVETCTALLLPKATEKCIELACFIDPRLAREHLGDDVRIRQILFNLLGNAIKFTATGEVRIAVRRLEVDEGRQRIAFAVSDTGIGISSENLRKLFQAFSQAEDDTTRKYGGTGLGLLISLRLAHLMDGDIQVQSEPGQGSTFTLTVELPAEQPDGPGFLVGKAIALVTNPESPDPDDAPGCYLEAWGARVQRVDIQSTGEVENATVDAWVLDVTHGLNAAAEKLEAALTGSSAPTVVLGSAEGYGGGASDILVDGRRVNICGCPLFPSALEQALRIVLGMQEDVQAAAPSMATAGLFFPPLSAEEAVEQGLVLLVAEDHPTNRVVVEMQLEAMGVRYEIYENGREALDAWMVNDHYFALLTDCHMPVMDGFELTSHIRARENTEGRAAMPVIAMTASALPEEVRKCLMVGMSDHLTKPATIERLRRSLARHVPLEKKSREMLLPSATGPVASVAPVATTPEVEVPAATPMASASESRDEAGVEIPVNLDELRKIFANSDRLVRAMDKFRVTLAEDLEGLSASLAAGNFDALRDIAHRIKGAARLIGANRLADVAQEIETDDESLPHGDMQALVEILRAAAAEVEDYLANQEPV